MNARSAPEYAIAGLWLAWVVYWWVASRGVRTTVRRESIASRLTHLIPLSIAVWMIGAPRMPAGFLTDRFLPTSWWLFLAGAIIVAAGLGLTVGARIHLGRNWSGTVTLKKGHELIMTGPYRFVRHPIYTGLLAAFAGSAIARGEWRGIVAFALAAAALWHKLKIEERWLGEAFGNDYARYRAKVAALVPFLL